MDSILEDIIFEFNKDTLQNVRKEYNLDQPERMKEAIDLLDNWVKKQDHFVVKNFPRDYLERIIIFCKGSMEKAKLRLEKTCTMKTLMSNFFKYINPKTDYKDSHILIDALLPKLTVDNYRIYVLKNFGKKFENGLTNYFKFILMLAEYILAHDYCNGIIIILDYRDTNIMELAKSLNIEELRQIFTLLMDGYGMRIKGIHFITSSGTITTIIAIMKQILSTKVGNRIQIHKDVESLHGSVPKRILPFELGGMERSLVDLHDEWVNVLSTNEYREYFQTTKEACTNEAYRQTDKWNNEYMGTPGAFRSLHLD